MICVMHMLSEQVSQADVLLVQKEKLYRVSVLAL